MKKLLLVITILLSFIFYAGCGTTKNHTNTWPQVDSTYALSGSRMYFEYNGNYCQYQIDSMIVADTLAPLNRWNDVLVLNTDNKPIYEYGFIKDTYRGLVIYSVIKMQPTDTIYKCTKKIRTK